MVIDVIAAEHIVVTHLVNNAGLVTCSAIKQIEKVER